MKTIYFVVPCYNEEAVLGETTKQLTAQLRGMIDSGLASGGSRMMFVDDGSRDRTWEIISENSASNPLVCGVKLSRNCGHQNALLAGMTTAKDLCDAVITLDADLQDDVGVIPEFVKKFEEGCEIVYGVRKSRATDTAFKRGTAHGFYGVMKKMGVELVSDHADYRLMSRRAIDALLQFREVNLFLRGMVPLIGFKTGSVFYERHERFAGESKYPLKKMVSFALDGITSFSVVPLHLINWAGGISLFVGLVGLIYALVAAIGRHAGAGWASIVGSAWFLAGVMMLCMGVTGEYVGRIYKEVKARPRFFIETTIVQ